jgi:8-oxo-dGTP diphosphatase
MSNADVIYLVRHAKAGERRVWEGDDEARPLSKHGWKQSEAIAKRLAAKGATSLYSSPYVRCMQTLEPLGKRLGVEVQADHRLYEGEPFEPVLELLTEVPTGAVLCSHGDIVPDVIQALARRGMEVQSPPDWRKGSIWVLKRKGDRITKGKVWPPPT